MGLLGTGVLLDAVLRLGGGCLPLGGDRVFVLFGVSLFPRVVGERAHVCVI